MSHAEQIEFFRQVLSPNSDTLERASIVEIGSYNVNGSVRSMVPVSAHYMGVDLAVGPGVDIVAFGHEVDLPTASIDVTISGECFEHDPHWRKTFANMIRLTRPGGLVLMSCASRGRPEHGTSRSTPNESPGTVSLGSEYYKNLNVKDFTDLHLERDFGEWFLWYNPRSSDLYFAGRRKGITEGKPESIIPGTSIKTQIKRITPWYVAWSRAPLNLLDELLPASVFHRFSIAYWRTILTAIRVGGRLKSRYR